MPAAPSLGRSQGDRGSAGRSGAPPPDRCIAAGGRSNERIETGGVNVGIDRRADVRGWVHSATSRLVRGNSAFAAESRHSSAVLERGLRPPFPKKNVE